MNVANEPIVPQLACTDRMLLDVLPIIVAI